MGWNDVKYMLTILLSIYIIAFAYSSSITDISGLESTKDTLKHVFDMAKVKHTPGVTPYNTTMNLSGSLGGSMDEWANKDTTLDIFSVISFPVAVWNWIIDSVVALINFAYAPIHLVNDFLRADNYDFLWWLPLMLYLIWTVMWSLTIIGLIWGGNS